MSEPLFIGAIVALAGAIGILWRQLVIERTAHAADRRIDSRLIFALLAERARTHSLRPPPTVSTPGNPITLEARVHAVEALNGDVDSLVREYLTEPSTKERRA